MAKDFVVKYDKAAIKLSKPGAVGKIVSTELSKNLLMAAKSLERPIKKRTPVNTGTLRRSIIGELVSPVESRVMTPVKYAEVIEEGAPPHPVSRAGIEGLKLWAKRKLKVKSDKEAKRAAFAIAAKIRKRGTKSSKNPTGAYRMFDKGLEDNRVAVEKIIDGLPIAVEKEIGK